MNELALFARAGGGILGGVLLGWNCIGAVEIETEAIRAKLPFISLAKRWKKHPGGALGEQIGWRVTCGLTIPPPPGHLNPEFHSWLMGFPTGWSGLQPLAMDKFQSWRRQHSAPFMNN